MMPRLSVIIPAWNEAPCIEHAVASARGADEIIVVDGQSRDETADRARSAGARVVNSARGRGIQLNAGARYATGERLLFLHADTILPDNYMQTVANVLADKRVSLGAFRLKIDSPGMSFRLIEYAVDLRSRLLGLPYGDQGLFLTKSRFQEIGGFPNWQSMEDYELARRARKAGRVAIADAAVVTSARRWQENGVWRQTLMNLYCLLCRRRNISPRYIHRTRERMRSAPSDSDSGTDRAVPAWNEEQL